MKSDYLKLKDFFQSYTKEFNLKKTKEQKNIDLKIDHSYRVVKNMEEIVSRMNLTEAEEYLAK